MSVAAKSFTMSLSIGAPMIWRSKLRSGSDRTSTPSSRARTCRSRNSSAICSTTESSQRPPRYGLTRTSSPQRLLNNGTVVTDVARVPSARRASLNTKRQFHPRRQREKRLTLAIDSHSAFIITMFSFLIFISLLDKQISCQQQGHYVKLKYSTALRHFRKLSSTRRSLKIIDSNTFLSFTIKFKYDTLSRAVI